MRDWAVRPEEERDREAVDALLREAFGGPAEADLVRALRKDGAVVLALVAEGAAGIAGHVVFSRLRVEGDGTRSPAVALAPLATGLEQRGKGLAHRLIEEGHRRLKAAGEALSVVLGDAAFYGRFGYAHRRAAGFTSPYQSPHLQALAWVETAPSKGRLVYADAFAAL